MNDKELEKLVASKVIKKASAEKLREIKDLDQRLKEFDSLFEIGEADIENYLTYNNVNKDTLNLDSIEAENLLPKQSPAIQESVKVDTSVKEKRLTPLEVAQGLSQKDNIPLQDAMQKVAGFPRTSRANLKGERFPILGTIGDILSATGRAGAAALSDEPFLESMGRIDANPYTQSGEQRGFFPMFLESIARDPSISAAPFTGAAALGAASKIKPLMKSIESGSRLAKAGRAGLAGAGATLADMTFEQSTRPEGFPMMSLGDYGLGLGLGTGLSALGGGLTKLKPKPGIEGDLSTSQPLINQADNPYTISQITNGEAAADAQVPSLGFGNVMDGADPKVLEYNPIADGADPKVLEYNPSDSPRDIQRQVNKELKKIDEDSYIVGGKKISKKRVDAVDPVLRQDYFKKFNPKLDIHPKEYVKIAKAKVKPNLNPNAPRAISSMEFAVQKQATPAYEAYKNNMNKLGEQIGKIRRELLPSIEPIKKDKFVEIINNALKDDAIDIKYVDIDGEQVLRPVHKDDPSLKVVKWDQNTKTIANLINDLSDDIIDGRDMRLFQSRLNKKIPEDPKNKQRIDTPETGGFISISKAIRETIDEGIENFAGEAVAKNFRETRAKWGRMKNTSKDIGGQLGKSVYFRNTGGVDVADDIDIPISEQLQDYEKAYTKGENAMKRIIQSQRAGGGKNNWDEVRSETGYDVAKAAAYALQAGIDAGDHTATSLLSNQQKIINALENPPTTKEGYKTMGLNLVKKPIISIASKAKQFISPDENAALRGFEDYQRILNKQKTLFPEVSLGSQKISNNQNLGTEALGYAQEVINPEEYLAPDFSLIQDLYRIPEKGIRQEEER